MDVCHTSIRKSVTRSLGIQTNLLVYEFQNMNLFPEHDKLYHVRWRPNYSRTDDQIRILCCHLRSYSGHYDKFDR